MKNKYIIKKYFGTVSKSQLFIEKCTLTKYRVFFINLFINLFFPFKCSESFTGCYKCYQILYQIENIQTQHRGFLFYVM